MPDNNFPVSTEYIRAERPQILFVNFSFPHGVSELRQQHAFSLQIDKQCIVTVCFLENLHTVAECYQLNLEFSLQPGISQHITDVPQDRLDLFVV